MNSFLIWFNLILWFVLPVRLGRTFQKRRVCTDSVHGDPRSRATCEHTELCQQGEPLELVLIWNLTNFDCSATFKQCLLAAAGSQLGQFGFNRRHMLSQQDNTRWLLILIFIQLLIYHALQGAIFLGRVSWQQWLCVHKYARRPGLQCQLPAACPSDKQPHLCR